jgi:hypothetical protein
MKIWTFIPLRAVALLALAACDPATTTQETQAAAPDGALDLSCTAFAEMSEAALRAAYGEGNLVEQTLPGAEGESYTATVLYADDPTRRLEIVWEDDATKMRPANVSVSGDASVWTGPNGLSIGDELAQIEQMNGRPFKLWGFGWDYGGWVSDWNGGALAPHDGCITRVRFEATAESNNAQGDREFLSDSAEIRGANPKVVAFALVFPTPE